MIKFFRQIRQQLLSENKFRQYLIYAIGEIILVVIGILLALQINTWNADSEKRKEEAILLQALEEDFLENRERLNETMSYQKGAIRYSNGFIQLMMSQTANTVSLDSILKLKAYGANSWYRVELVNSTFKTIVSSGKSDLLRNRELVKKLVEFSADVDSGFEDDYESKESLVFMNNLAYPYEASFMHPDDREDFGMKVSEDSLRSSMNELLSNKAYLGSLINKTNLESSRLDYQKKLWDRTNEILKEIQSENRNDL